MLYSDRAVVNREARQLLPDVVSRGQGDGFIFIFLQACNVAANKDNDKCGPILSHM
jgi:hypothetical protein